MVKVGKADAIKSKHPKVKWTPEEKDTVKEGVKLFGTSSWTAMKEHFGLILERRSANQLKDCHLHMLHKGFIFEESACDRTVDSALLSPETKDKLKKDKNKKKRRRSSTKAKHFNTISAVAEALGSGRKKSKRETIDDNPT